MSNSPDLPDHNYDPSWDYEVIDLPAEAAPMVARVEALVRTEIFPALGLSYMRVAFVENLTDDVLARFCSGTGRHPVIVVDWDALNSACAAHGLDVEQQLAATLAHELAHAYQENLGVEEHGDEEEDDAEEFARQWVTAGVVDVTCLTDNL